MQQSLQQLQALGEQLKSQVDASSVAALQSDHRSLVHRLATLEHGLHRHQEILQVRRGAAERVPLGPGWFCGGGARVQTAVGWGT